MKTQTLDIDLIIDLKNAQSMLHALHRKINNKELASKSDSNRLVNLAGMVEAFNNYLEAEEMEDLNEVNNAVLKLNTAAKKLREESLANVSEGTSSV